MIKQEPTFWGLDRDGSSANLGALPTTSDTKDKAVLSPVDQVGATAEVDIAEWGVPVITRAAKHDVLPIDPAWKKNPIAVERQQGIFQEVKLFEIESVSDANRWTMVSIAPANVIAVFQPEHAWVIAVLELSKLRVSVDPVNGLVIQLPMDAILRETAVQVHVTLFIVTAEDTGILAFEWHNCAVKYAVGGWDLVARDDGVGAVTPDHVCAAGWSFLPGDIRKCWVGHGWVSLDFVAASQWISGEAIFYFIDDSTLLFLIACTYS